MQGYSGRNERTGTTGNALTYLWEVPRKPVSVRINLQVADRLDREATAAVRSLSALGSEIGGLLLGTMTPGDPIRVTVDEYLRIPCDHTRGPLYELGKADMERFDRVISTRELTGNRVTVVGFFRSHTRKGLSLTDEDIAFCKARFGSPHQIVLLVRPGIAQASRAGIFIWENAAMRGDATCLEFPFSTDELVKKGLATSAPRETPPPAVSDIHPEPVQPQAPRPPIVREAPKRAQVVQFVAKREAPAPAPPPPPVVEKPAPIPPKSDREKIEARVGRCCVKVQLRADPARSSSKALRESGIRLPGGDE